MSPKSYIHTYSAQLYNPKNKINYEELIFNISETGLISLISGLQNTNFGLDTLTKVIKRIQQIKKVFLTNKELYIDSGGYSIIAGDVHPHNLSKFINCYNKFLESERQNFDYIFSLDIPIFLKYPKYNTKQKIYNFNKKSLTETIKIIKQFPELENKFIFVWQFKLKSQYEIWNKLYNELEINKISHKQAIGGMVGLIGRCKLNFSPFIALCFKCLLNYVQNEKYYQKQNFSLHLLGVYHKFSRFVLYLLQDLFSCYLKQEVRITFDTINYFLTAQYKARDNFYFFDFQQNKIQIYKSFFKIPQQIIENIYTTDTLKENFNLNLNHIKNNKKLDNINFVSPLYLKSELNYDLFLKYLIKKYNIIESIFEAKNQKHFLNLLKSFLLTLKFTYKFTSDSINSIQTSLKMIYIFHQWFQNDRDEAKLENYIYKFIQKINFPFDLD